MNKAELIERLKDLPREKGEYELKNERDHRMYQRGKNFIADVVVHELERLDEPEKAVVPKWFDEWVDKEIDSMSSSLYALSDVLESNNYSFWKLTEEQNEYITGNFPKLADAIVNGYRVEEEPKYYAKIIGSELIKGAKVYWHFNKNNNFLYIDRIHDHKDDVLSNWKATIEEWNNLGVNETNAIFEGDK